MVHYIYGALYTYAAAKLACPIGWRLPADEDWEELKNYISNDGFNENEGYALKSNTDWLSIGGIDGNGIDKYGFKALPGGDRSYSSGTYSHKGVLGLWWSSTDDSILYPNNYGVSNEGNTFGNYASYKTCGFSVRCIKNLKND